MWAASAAWGPASLALCILAARAGAFVPADVAHLPHVAVNPAISKPPLSGQGQAGAGAAPQQRQSQLPAGMYVQPYAEPPALVLSVASEQASASPKASKTNIAKIITDWGKKEATDLAVVDGVKTVLDQMDRDITTGIPEYAFALTGEKGDKDIQAIALVSRRKVSSANYFLDIAVNPVAERQKGAAGELVRQLGDWGGGRNRKVEVFEGNAALQGYYDTITSESPAGKFGLVQLVL